MKKLLLIIMLLMFSSLAMAATVTRDMPSTIEPNNELTVRLRITNIDSLTEIAVDDVVPLPITNWNIEGTAQSKDEITYRFQDNRASWVFVPNSNQATITYTVNIPNVQRSYTFGPLIWIDEDRGMGQIDATNLNVATTTTTTTTTTIEQPTTTTTVQETTTTTTMPEEIIIEEEVEGNYVWLIIVLLLIVAGIVAYFLLKKKDY